MLYLFLHVHGHWIILHCQDNCVTTDLHLCWAEIQLLSWTRVFAFYAFFSAWETLWTLNCGSCWLWSKKEKKIACTHTHTLTAEWTVSVMNGAEMCSRAAEVPGQACLPSTTTQIFMRLFAWKGELWKLKLLISASLQVSANLGVNNVSSLINLK